MSTLIIPNDIANGQSADGNEVGANFAAIETWAAEQADTDYVDNLALPTAWTAVTFTNSWTDFGGGFAAAKYRKVGDRVEVRGVISGGTTATSAFTLPVNFRPPTALDVAAVAAGAFGHAVVNTDGTVVIHGTAPVSLAFEFSITA